MMGQIYSITAAALKQKLLSEWPRGCFYVLHDLFWYRNVFDKSVVPKSVNDMKVIHGGKVLENVIGKTLYDSGLNVGGKVITMHVVVQPLVSKQKKGKDQQTQHSMFLHYPLKISNWIWYDFNLGDVYRVRNYIKNLNVAVKLVIILCSICDYFTAFSFDASDYSFDC